MINARGEKKIMQFIHTLFFDTTLLVLLFFLSLFFEALCFATADKEVQLHSSSPTRAKDCVLSNRNIEARFYTTLAYSFSTKTLIEMVP